MQGDYTWDACEVDDMRERWNDEVSRSVVGMACFDEQTGNNCGKGFSSVIRRQALRAAPERRWTTLGIVYFHRGSRAPWRAKRMGVSAASGVRPCRAWGTLRKSTSMSPGSKQVMINSGNM